MGIHFYKNPVLRLEIFSVPFDQVMVPWRHRLFGVQFELFLLQAKDRDRG